MKKVTKRKTTNVRSHVREQNGKMVQVSRHTRTIEQNALLVTKKEYADAFKKQPAKNQKRDKAHTKKNAVDYNKKIAELPLKGKKGMTQKVDWVGIDGKKIEKAKKTKTRTPKGLKHTESTRYDDAGYDKAAYRDSRLSRHENDELSEQRHSLRNIGIGW